MSELHRNYKFDTFILLLSAPLVVVVVGCLRIRAKLSRHFINE